MQFATLEGKLVKSGGMVVKNVAGLDMAKLMIGSFGTLAAIAVVNFKVQPMPEVERSFLLPFDSLRRRHRGAQCHLEGPVAAGGHRPAEPGCRPGRWASPHGCWRCAPAATRPPWNATSTNSRSSPTVWHSRTSASETLWRHVENFTPRFLAAHEDGAVVRASCTLKDSEAVMASFPGPAVARAGSGVCYGYFERSQAAADWLSSAQPVRLQGSHRVRAREQRGERSICGLLPAAILKS